MFALNDISVKSSGTRRDGRMSANFTMNNARYHVWFDPTTMKLIEPLLYKNPLNEVKPRDAGYFATRRLDATKKRNAPIIAQLLRAVINRRLVAMARQEQKQIEADETHYQLIQTFVRDYWARMMSMACTEPLPASITPENFQMASQNLAKRL